MGVLPHLAHPLEEVGGQEVPHCYRRGKVSALVAAYRKAVDLIEGLLLEEFHHLQGNLAGDFWSVQVTVELRTPLVLE